MLFPICLDSFNFVCKNFLGENNKSFIIFRFSNNRCSLRTTHFKHSTYHCRLLFLCQTSRFCGCSGGGGWARVGVRVAEQLNRGMMLTRSLLKRQNSNLKLIYLLSKIIKIHGKTVIRHSRLERSAKVVFPRHPLIQKDSLGWRTGNIVITTTITDTT